MEDYKPLTLEEKLAAAQREQNPFLLNHWLLTLPTEVFRLNGARDWLDSLLKHDYLMIRRAARQRIDDCLKDPVAPAVKLPEAMSEAA